ncbi:MAG: hypothetical protein C0403_19655 [Desulfobacterium sp.]|nr:hypothetical protein [Desulfobacterium sp.]
MKLEKLKEKYKNKDIIEIESLIEKTKINVESEREKLISLLFYLESTHRWRENPLYKNTIFPDYIKAKYNMTFNQYHAEKMAFIVFPKEVKKIGLGNTTRAIKNCGVYKAKETFKIIEKEKKPTNEKIIEIIKRHTPQKPIQIKPNISELKEKEERYIGIMKTDRQTIEDLETQIEKLKGTIIVLKARNKQLEQENENLKIIFNTPLNKMVKTQPATV